MIHWGTELPSQSGKIQLPDGLRTLDDDLLDVRSVMNKRLYYSENQRLVSSLSQLNLHQLTTSDSSSSQTSSEKTSRANSQSNMSLIGSVWLNKLDRIHHPVDKEVLRRKSEFSYKKFLLTRQISNSCHDFCSGRRTESASDFVLRIDHPSSIKNGSDFAIYMSIANRTESDINMMGVLRIDAGRKKIRTIKKPITLQPFETEEISLLFGAEDLWQELKGDEKQLTIIATVHVVETGAVISKVEHTKISWPKLSISKHLFSNNGNF